MTRRSSAEPQQHRRRRPLSNCYRMFRREKAKSPSSPVVIRTSTGQTSGEPTPLSSTSPPAAAQRNKPNKLEQITARSTLTIAMYVVLFLLALSGGVAGFLGAMFLQFLYGAGEIIQQRYTAMGKNLIYVAAATIGAALVCLWCFFRRKAHTFVTITLLLAALMCADLFVVYRGYAVYKNGSAEAKSQLSGTIDRYFDYEQNPVSQLWDRLQTAMACCGVDSILDWVACGEVPASCGKAAPEMPGCLGVLMEKVRHGIVLSYPALIVLVFIEIATIAVLGCLTHEWNKARVDDES